jgi:hypothetical protein
VIDLKETHRDAVEQADLALAAGRRGDRVQALAHIRRAYELEAEAANALVHDFQSEPTRSVLFRSAATLALDCSLFAEAEKLACTGLIGNPPEQIAEELRDVLEQVHFQRHLALRGVELRPDEVQMSIAGNAVGYGIAPIEAFLQRVENTENLLYRTAERKQNRPYRDRGRVDKTVAQNLQLYVTVPRAASFAITFKVGRQLELPGISVAEEVIDELLDCLEIYNRGDETLLRARIVEEPYYRNFIGLARVIQPDGKRVGVVGFTSVRRGATRQVALTATTENTPTLQPRDIVKVEERSTRREPGPKLVEVSGILKMADSRKRLDEIQIIEGGNIRHTIIVPEGMMSDIVKPLWDAEVAVSGVRKGQSQKIHLMQIRPVEPEVNR